MSENRDSKLNAKEIEEARCFLTFLAKRSEPYCGQNTDESKKGCGKPISRLYLEWVAKRNLEGRDLIRKHPLLVINEKKGFGLHRYRNGNFDYCGNINFFCYSCNQKEKREYSNIKTEKSDGYSNIKSRKVRPAFKEKLKDHLVKHGDICEEACVNKWSNSEDFDCAQKLLKECISQMMDTEINQIKILDYGIECHYSLCNGFHLIHADPKYQPLPKMTDEEFAQKELQEQNKLNNNTSTE